MHGYGSELALQLHVGTLNASLPLSSPWTFLIKHEMTNLMALNCKVLCFILLCCLALSYFSVPYMVPVFLLYYLFVS